MLNIFQGKMYALPKYILALPLFFAAQKTQQHQIYFCVHFTVSNLTNTFLQSTKSIFCSQHFCTGQHLMQSNFAKSKHFIYKIAFYHFVNSKQNVKACKAYFITSIFFFKRKRFFKNALKF